MKYIAYYRVSTNKQEQSGLGLDAQRSMVESYIAPELIDAEFVETESGRKKYRPKLNEALALCREHNATLVIAKLDRLARNVSFISTLRDSGVKFVAVDMPEANNTMIYILAVIAEAEAEAISARTKSALEAKKRQGYKLGTVANLTNEGRAMGRAVITHKAQTNPNNVRAKAYISALRNGGNKLTLQEMAQNLNSNGFKTSKGKQFTPMQVSRLIAV